jgi:prepilin-type N-terminal cleavage/methylation domain-containing protein
VQTRAPWRPDDGFTLLELAIVTVIIGVLAAVATPVFVGQQVAAQDAASRDALQLARAAMKSYSTKYGGAVTSDPDLLIDLGWPAATATALVIDAGPGPGEFCIDTISAAGHPFVVTEQTGVEAGAC